EQDPFPEPGRAAGGPQAVAGGEPQANPCAVEPPAAPEVEIVAAGAERRHRRLTQRPVAERRIRGARGRFPAKLQMTTRRRRRRPRAPADRDLGVAGAEAFGIDAAAVGTVERALEDRNLEAGVESASQV